MCPLPRIATARGARRPSKTWQITPEKLMWTSVPRCAAGADARRARKTRNVSLRMADKLAPQQPRRPGKDRNRQAAQRRRGEECAPEAVALADRAEDERAAGDAGVERHMIEANRRERRRG